MPQGVAWFREASDLAVRDDQVVVTGPISMLIVRLVVGRLLSIRQEPDEDCGSKAKCHPNGHGEDTPEFIHTDDQSCRGGFECKDFLSTGCGCRV